MRSLELRGGLRRGHVKLSREFRDLARQRIWILLSLADNVVKRDQELARRYVALALKLAAKARLRLPRDVRRRYCRRCKVPLIPGLTARVRVRSRRQRHIVVTCLKCGYVRRYVTVRRVRCDEDPRKRL